MKRIIEGKLYNTETAAKLCELACDFSKGNFRWHDTALYQTRGGAFFLAGEGHAMSMWATRFDNMHGPGDGIRPVSAEEACHFLEQGNKIDILGRIFGPAPEAGASLPYALPLPSALRPLLEKAAESEGRSLDAIICGAIELYLTQQPTAAPPA
jgi:hypothetical protein